MSLWTASEAASATGGAVASDWVATGVSIDTRTLQPGDLFVALKDVRDGHDFVAQALEKGAAAALVSREPDGVDTSKLLIVNEVLSGLEALGRAARARTHAQVIGITGSVGKTSTKEMLRTILERQGRTHAAEASYNNHWGVPLTLARMPADTEFAIIEIGMNHPGEIGPLARMAGLTQAMITTIAAAHLEAFEDGLAGIAREKGAIFEGLVPGGAALIPGDLAETPLLEVAASGAQIVKFGSGDHASRLLDLQLTDTATVARASVQGTEILFKLAQPGRHFGLNALASVTMAALAGADLALAAQDIAHWVPPKGRGTRVSRALDPIDSNTSFDLIDDAFNANPTSMEAALEVLAAATPRDGVGRIGEGRRIAILGDMLELGPDEQAMHEGVAAFNSVQDLHVIHCVGLRMRALYDCLDPAQRGEWAEEADTLAAEAHRLIDAGDVVLIKGSKGSKVSRVVDALMKLSHPVAMGNED